MVAIRLKRVGKKGHASFRFVVSDKSKDTIGPALEILGSYNPHINPPEIKVKKERVQYWLGKGAKPSATVHNLLVTAGVINAPKVVIVKAKKPAKDEKAEPKTKPAKPEAKAEIKTEAKKTEEPAKS
ncbi:30S ribosomal protein S16 [Candidatus Parcubacteria bacterium]|jgi:small subunit ribosomal protein S16|nr:MAG: 30S ribosomal protein S16 [Candidatus Parcubacteria bacterium]